LARSMRVRSDLIASPYVLSRGELSMTAAVPGDTALASGNNIVAARLAEAFNRGVSFAAARGLPATTTTLADSSGQILGLNATASGNATGADRLAGALNRGASFAAGGGLPATAPPLADYRGQIPGLNATAAANAPSPLGYEQSLCNGLRFRADSVSGVNLDEE